MAISCTGSLPSTGRVMVTVSAGLAVAVAARVLGVSAALPRVAHSAISAPAHSVIATVTMVFVGLFSVKVIGNIPAVGHLWLVAGQGCAALHAGTGM